MTMTMFFVLLGVAASTMSLMKLVEWLDTPHDAPRRMPRRAAAGSKVVEFPCAELELESALYAA